MPDQSRAIIHLDLDAFFAAVEMLENPDLAGKPLVVGGSPEGRGVVAAASYPARAFGIHSAMPTYRALKLCPHVIVLPPRHRLYWEYSRRVMAILQEATPVFEQISVDEAFLDLTEQVAEWDAVVRVAKRLQNEVRVETGLSASLGVASNKLVAKVASDRDKPGGLTVVRPGEEAAFLAPLPVRVLWGVGPVTAGKLGAAGVTTVGELASLSKDELTELFGRHGASMARRARGEDRGRVVTERDTKSVSHERTFAHDLVEFDALKAQLWIMSKGVAKRLKRNSLAASTVAVKLRYTDFTTLSRQMTLAVPSNDEREIYRAAVYLLGRAWKPKRPIRLLGVAGRHLTEPPCQLPLL